ncbi:mycoredoxin [Bifidobacterium sp. ESL0745]|uniref:mycoredoxin n=1 Tax=Bifidobacterium sp. ESL0745 TaxID=2983226 RepID=UPI0023F6746A|nr:mycoredoxin [Bifidobacterium sp. ESL0745]MDF7666184.1 mycoredoxin [Bifidobacterium sp. ESL0745]
MADSNSATIEIYGADWCGDCRRAKAALDRFGITYNWHDIEHDDGAEAKAIEISGQKHIPVVVFRDGSFEVEPSATDLKTKLEALGQF